MKGVTPPVSLFYQAETSNQFEYSIKFYRTNIRLKHGRFHQAGRPSPATRGRTSAKPFRHQTRASDQDKNACPKPLASFPQYSHDFRNRKSHSDGALSATSRVLTSARLGMVPMLSVFIGIFPFKNLNGVHRKSGAHRAQKAHNCRRLETKVHHLKTPLS